jgi:large subunit ribosomal protein L21
MYAIIRAGGKQAKVREGDVIDVERIKSDGDSVTFTPLLLVSADILGESRGEKIDIFKYKNKTGYRRRQGHRQRYTRIQVTGISTGAKKATKKKAAPKKAAEAEPEAAAEEASDSAATAAEEA